MLHVWQSFLYLSPRLKKDDESLFIPNVNEGDEGTYTCTAKSEIDQLSASARLTVLGTLTHRLLFHYFITLSVFLKYVIFSYIYTYHHHHHHHPVNNMRSVLIYLFNFLLLQICSQPVTWQQLVSIEFYLSSAEPQQQSPLCRQTYNDTEETQQSMTPPHAVGMLWI